MSLTAFVKQVAELRQNGEDDGEGSSWSMTTDDAAETLHVLIDQARSILAISPTANFEKLALKAKKKAYGDSNDGEIAMLQDAVSEACILLGVDDTALGEQAYEWAEKHLW